MRLLEYSVTHAGSRALHAARVETEVKLVRKQGHLSTMAEVRERHNFTEEAAHKFLRAVARALRRPANPDTESLVKRKKALTPSVLAAAPLAPRNIPEVWPNAPAPTLVRQAQLAAILADIRRRFKDEIRTQGEQTSVKEGFIYLVIHPSFAGWIKVGMTIDYEARLATYNVADPLSRFELAATKWVDNRRTAEKQLLERLRQTAEEMRGEWARIALADAIEVFDVL